MIALCSHAPAQTLTGGWTIRVSNTVSPSQPVAEIEVWAWFDPGGGLLFVLGDFDLVAGEGSFGRPQLASGIVGEAGVVAASAVTDVLTGQIHVPNLVWGSLANPIHVWSVFWETPDYTPRTVSLDTRNTTQFLLDIWAGGGAGPFQLYPQGFTPGTGAIQVVPSPASATLLVLGAVMLRRRRRAV